MKLKSCLIAIALACASVEPALAYATDNCFGLPKRWEPESPTMNISPTSFPDGPWRNVINSAIDKVNAHPSPFFFQNVTDTGGAGLDNDISEIWGTSNAAILDGAPAATAFSANCFIFMGNVIRTIIETDVFFDFRAPFAWTPDQLKTSLFNYSGSLESIHTAAIHELGHALGLDHVNSEYNIMGNDWEHIWVNGNTARGYLGEDAADGAVFIYGLWSADWQDLGVSHWRYEGAPDAYSDHKRTGIYDTSDVLLRSSLVGGERVYRVSRGQQVRPEFTYENNGKSTQTVNTGWYISTNHVISRTDRLIAENTGMTLSRNNVLTYRRTVTIPSDLAINTDYWLGTIVDKDSTVADRISSNNATYIRIRVIR